MSAMGILHLASCQQAFCIFCYTYSYLTNLQIPKRQKLQFSPLFISIYEISYHYSISHTHKFYSQIARWLNLVTSYYFLLCYIKANYCMNSLALIAVQWAYFSAIVQIHVMIHVMFDYMNHNIGFFSWKKKSML